MGTKVKGNIYQRRYREAILKILAELDTRSMYFAEMYEKTQNEIYLRMIRRIGEKIKMLEELL
jgi:hypothetical protein